MFLVVEFLGEFPEYSVIPLEYIVDGTVRLKYKSMVGKQLEVVWNRQHFEAILRGYGTKREMNAACNDLASKAAEMEISEEEPQKKEGPKNSRGSKKGDRRSAAQKIASILAQRSTVGSSAPTDIIDSETPDEPPVAGGSACCTSPKSSAAPASDHALNDNVPCALELKVEELEKRVQKLKKSKAKYQEKFREEQARADELEKKLKADISSKKVELVSGSGVFLRKSKIAAAKLGSRTPTILARNLFRYVFTLDETKGRSLMGRTCNANKDIVALPSVNAEKRDAVIEFSLASFNMKPSPGFKGLDQYQIEKGRIVTSLTKLLREGTRKEG